jgi:hypothetical protein
MYERLNKRFEEKKIELEREGKSIIENEKGQLEIDGKPIYEDNGDIANNLLDYARKDEEGKRHIRLSASDKTDTIDEIDESYKELVGKVYNNPQGFNHFSERIVNEFWKVPPDHGTDAKNATKPLS